MLYSAPAAKQKNTLQRMNLKTNMVMIEAFQNVIKYFVNEIYLMLAREYTKIVIKSDQN